MMEKAGGCPLCAAKVEYEDGADRKCPECNIELHAFWPIVRGNRSWFWVLTENAEKELLAVWMASQKGAGA